MDWEYEDGWFVGEVKYCNKKLLLDEYIIDFSDGLRLFVKEEDFNDTEF